MVNISELKKTDKVMKYIYQDNDIVVKQLTGNDNISICPHIKVICPHIKVMKYIYQDNDIVKQLTGNNKISIRPLYSDQIHISI